MIKLYEAKEAVTDWIMSCAYTLGAIAIMIYFFLFFALLIIVSLKLLSGEISI